MPTPIQRQAFGLKILNAGHPSIRKLKSQGFQAEIHGNKFWNSSFLVMDYLKRNPLPQGIRVLEIGCGWGLLPALSPNTPAFRAIPFPEVTEPICRLPLPTLFYRPEAIHLGDLLRIWVHADATPP